MKYFSGFSGIGGFELGIEKATKDMGWVQQEVSERTNSQNSKDKRRLQNCWECIGFSEIDKYAIETYLKHFPTHKNYGNARDINPKELPDFDMFCGGFPCQSFSIAGKRKGFQDTRGTLFHEILRIVAVKKPRLLFLENVKGLLSADNGRCFATIISSLDELGYDVEWQVLNSKHFGVPQNRERVFIIGHLRGTSTRQVFPIRKDDNSYSFRKGRTESKTQFYTAITPKEGGRKQNNFVMVWSQSNSGSDNFMQRIKTTGEFNTLNTGEGGRTQSSQNFINSNDKIRRLTPTECERLQGFPDGWTIGSDTQRYKQCGNAVTVNVIEAIMNNVIFN